MTRNNSRSDDLRVQRTHKLILDALLELTVQKGFSAISVSDITRHAGINRATFYRHYTDKFDVLNKYAQSIYELLDTVPPQYPEPDAPGADRMISGLVRIFDHIRDNATFYRVMLGRNGNPAFADQIRQYIQKRIRRSLPAGLPKDKVLIDLYVAYSSSASVGVVLWWLENDLPYSSEELAGLLRRLEAGNLNALLQ